MSSMKTTHPIGPTFRLSQFDEAQKQLNIVKLSPRTSNPHLVNEGSSIHLHNPSDHPNENQRRKRLNINHQEGQIGFLYCLWKLAPMRLPLITSCEWMLIMSINTVKERSRNSRRNPRESGMFAASADTYEKRKSHLVRTFIARPALTTG